MLVGIQLAGYRTAIFAMGPLAVATLWIGITTSVRRDQRPFMAGVGAALAVILVGVAVVFYADKFADIATIAANPGALIKPPVDFTWADKQLLSARAYIWSSYVYAWKRAARSNICSGSGRRAGKDCSKSIRTTHWSGQCTNSGSSACSACCRCG